MAYDEKLAARVRKGFVGVPGVSEKKMFGGLCVLENRAMCCGLVGDELMARVGSEAYDAALAMPHTRPMDFTGRPMRGFVFVAAQGCATQAQVNAWVGRSRAFVAWLADRPSVEAEFQQLLSIHTPGVRRVAQAARALVKNVVPAATEAVRRGWKLLGFSAPRYFACVVPMKDHVRIGFEHGRLLDDQWELFDSGGRQMKWIIIRKPADLKHPGIAALIAQAAEIATARPKGRPTRRNPVGS